MKKFLTLAVIMLLAASYSMNITRNRVMGLAGLTYMMTEMDFGTGDVSVTSMGLLVPNIEYQMEAKPTDMFKMYIYGGLDYEMAKASVDGEAADNFSSHMGIWLKPMGKIYLPNNLFVKIGLPFEYNSDTSDADDAEAMADMKLDLNADFGFDNREVYIHGLTPWDMFEKGICAYAFYDMGIMASQDVVDPVSGDIESVDAEEFASYFGVFGSYAHFADAMMIKPWLQYKMGMNDKVDENGYFNLGVQFAKDLNEQMMIEANLDFGMTMLPEEDLAGNDAYNTLEIDAMFGYYVMPELAVGAGLGMYMDLTTEDANPIYGFMVGAEYTLDLLKK